GRHEFSVHAQADNTVEWTQHAAGTLSAEIPEPPAALASWPPPGAEPVDVSGLYDQLADAGYQYGPTFRGLRGAWRRDDEVYAEVRLPEGDAGDFGVHPALLDAAQHALALRADADWSRLRLPF